MKDAVEVAHLVNGELVTLRRLSVRRERVGALMGSGLVVGTYLIGMLAVACAARLMGRSIYVPEFLGLWVAFGAVVSVFAYVRVANRLKRYTLGSRLDADAFAPFETDLVRRVSGAAGRYELVVLPGMQGLVETGRAPLPLEAIAGGPQGTVCLERDMRAEVRVGPATFVVRVSPAPARARQDVPRDAWRLFSRAGIAGLELALVGTLFALVPDAQTIGARAPRIQASRQTTPWEVEKRLRAEAQEQASSLHQCFDPLPLTCQHAGYIGVGVSLNRDGELRSNWIARSTYGRECPVDQCMKDVVSTWTFDPLPEPMRVILPVQVLRTERPMPAKVAAGDPWSPTERSWKITRRGH